MSSFSEFTVMDVTQVVKVDLAVPPSTASLVSCSATTGVRAAWKLAKVEPGSSVSIFGLDAVGLAVAEGARICGASKINGVDLNPDKQEHDKAFFRFTP
ncbi:alcohol dehydrogenase-like 7 [Hordeum vulgare]|nr:alcohol dehydrogenase-like 7 [Hordeum vulgare]